MFWRKKTTINEDYRCSVCGKIHSGLPALSFIAPYYYDILSESDKNKTAEISDDFCIIRHPEQTDRFIRTVLSIPIQDSCETFDYGIWVSVSEMSFEDYQKNFKNERREKTYFGMICNEIADYDKTTLGLHVNIEVRKNGIRPEIKPHLTEHQLIADWENGITLGDAKKRILTATNNVG